MRTVKPIPRGEYITEYKYKTIHYTAKARQRAEEEYEKNKEGCYILDVHYEGKKIYLDATRKFKSFGR